MFEVDHRKDTERIISPHYVARRQMSDPEMRWEIFVRSRGRHKHVAEFCGTFTHMRDFLRELEMGNGHASN